MTESPPNADSHSRIVMLAFGRMEHGGQYWCYVAVKPSRYEEYKAALDSKTYNMQRFADDGFGEVIVSGEGSLPPTEITKKVAAMFGIPIKQLFAQADPMQSAEEKIKSLNLDK